MAIFRKNKTTVANRVKLADSFVSEIVNSNTYIGIGTVLNPTGAWANNVVPVPRETTSSFNGVLRNLIALKAINGADVCRVIPRFDWVSGIIYQQYEPDVDMFSYNSYNQLPGTVAITANTNIVKGTSTYFTSNLTIGSLISVTGDGINSGFVTKEVAGISNNTYLITNSAFSAAYTSNNLYATMQTYPYYSRPFYVRNIKDQVFKCLFNNYGVTSSYMPELTISGDLPENPYIQTADGYKWKYMYTIPPGLKEKFFTQDWMPVLQESVVVNSAVDGRIDVVQINYGGSGYVPLLGESATDQFIVNIDGDGTGALMSADINVGMVTNINIYNGGSGYSYAHITINDPTQTSGGVAANLTAMIGPTGGHGSDVYSELGATTVMVSPSLVADENGTIPTVSDTGDVLCYGQISIICDPLKTDGSFLTGSNYRTSYIIQTTGTNGGYNFKMGETAYVGPSLVASTFSGTVIDWLNINTNSPSLWLNNVYGTFTPPSVLTGTVSSNGAVTGLTFSAPDYKPHSGKVLYVENRTAIYRDPSQTEQLKLTISF